MKFAAALALVAAATVVSAETNAQRMARGLPPNAPAKRASPVEGAYRRSASGTPSQCNTGSIQCCDSVGSSGSNTVVDEILSFLNINVPSGTSVGVSCSGTTACTQQPVCCSNNSFNGIVSIGCSPSE
ncbi:hydrophobin [Butyriboletus roseoflavus]|nr:hydrophobin [Butyriboletus roseoflavus]